MHFAKEPCNNERTSLVGGSRGIGRAVSLKLASDGYAVAVGYVSGKADGKVTVDTIVRAGGTAYPVNIDLGDPGTIDRAFECRRAVGTATALVSNAGILGDKARIDQQTAEGLEHLFSVNVVGTIMCAKHAILRMSTRHGGNGGSIVMLSSVGARLGGLGGLAPYTATKGAIETLTRGLAIEVAKKGIRVNAVAPGIIETSMTGSDAREIAEKVVPMGRVGAPFEIAEAVSWLVSPASSFVTGAILTASRGR